MVQPKKPPVSIRIPDEIVEQVAAWAKKRKITRNAAYARLIADGLKANGPSLPAPDVQAKMKGYVRKAQAKPAERVSVSIPYAGTFTRKPMQKGAKK